MKRKRNTSIFTCRTDIEIEMQQFIKGEENITGKENESHVESILFFNDNGKKKILSILFHRSSITIYAMSMFHSY